MNVGLSSGIDRGSIVFSLIDRPLEIPEPVPGDHRANVRISLETLNRGSKHRSRSEFLGPSYNYIVKFVVLGLVDDQFLDADAILTSILANCN